ncbi:MAG: hypothetical protein IT510_17585 [Sulfuritalea sp.]|nr:hypothetical protein [Sulfuritalea sp.]
MADDRQVPDLMNTHAPGSVLPVAHMPTKADKSDIINLDGGQASNININISKLRLEMHVRGRH